MLWTLEFTLHDFLQVWVVNKRDTKQVYISIYLSVNV